MERPRKYRGTTGRQLSDNEDRLKSTQLKFDQNERKPHESAKGMNTVVVTSKDQDEEAQEMTRYPKQVRIKPVRFNINALTRVHNENEQTVEKALDGIKSENWEQTICKEVCTLKKV